MESNIPSEETLRQLYVVEGLGTSDIAKRLGVSRTQIYRGLNLYRIERRGKTNPRIPGRDEMHRLYVNENQSAEAIAARCDVTTALVFYYLRRYEIPRDRTERNSRAPDVDELRRFYVDENLTAEQIAERIGYSRSRTFYLLRRYGIEANKRISTLDVDPPQKFAPPDRPYPLPDRRYPFDGEWLRARYWDDNLNSTQIAVELGVRYSVVLSALHKHEVPIKPMWLAFRDKVKRYGDFSLRMRGRIRLRDHGCCQCCGSITEPLECHHIIPTRFGGRNSVENGILLCTACHDTVGFHELNHAEELLALRGTKTGQVVSA